MRRREFVGVTAFSALQLFVQGCRQTEAKPKAGDRTTGAVRAPKSKATQIGFGPLVERSKGLLDLPAGFDYVILQKAGDPLSDGHVMPQQPDGMACFLDGQGRYVLMRNHELGHSGFMKKFGYNLNPFKGGQVPKPHYEDGFFGGVVRVVMDPARLAADLKGKSENPKAVIASNFVLTGTASNCSGGVLPEGWVTCEESGRAGHGYAFLTRPGDEKLMAPRPIKGWGRFPREGIVLDAATGVVYMTEDRWDGCFYRYVPTNPKDYMGPGRLQALSIKGLKTTSPYPKPKDDQPTPRLWKDNQTWAVTWVDIDDPSAAKVTCRAQAIAKGATTFSRSEGIAWSGRSAWLSASLGGPAGAGQIFEYLPDASNSDVGKLVLRYEVSDRSILSCPDNVCMAPWQDLVMAEDNYSKNHQVTHQYIRGMDQKGRVYDIARNRRHFPGSKKPGAEFAGVCFSPDGKYLFVNLQSPENVTVAIKGPWA